MMGRRLDLQHLSEEECEKILEVIQRDFNIRQGEKERLTKIEESIDKEKKTREILAEKETFNENCCMRCCDTFNFIFNRKRVCVGCKYNVCKNCCVYDDNVKDYVCSTCQKHRELVTKSCDWFYQDVKRRFRRFGSAKVVRSLFKRRPEYDEASESGLGAQKPPLEVDSIDGAGGLNHAKQLHFDRYDKQLNSIRDKVYNMLRKRFNNDHLKLKGMRPNHGLLESYRKEISIDLTNLAQALYLAYENHPSEENKEINKLVQETLVKRVEAFVGHPVVVTLPNNLDEDDSSATDDDDSLCDDHPFEDQLADHIIAQILDSFKSENDNGPEPIISANKHRPAPIKEGSHESLDAESEIQGNLNRTFDSEDEDEIQSSIHRSDSNRVNPLMSPRRAHSNFHLLGSPLPSFGDIQSPLGKREIDPDDLATIDQNSDDFENIPDYDDDINYLERPTSVHDGNNWTFSLKDESGDKVENMEYQEWVKNIRRPSSTSFSTKPIKNIVNTTQDFGRVSPMIGNREVDDLTDSSICSDDDDDDDDEVAEVPHPGDISMESREIAEITKNMSPIMNVAVANVPVEVCQPDVPKTEEAVEACTDPRFEMKPMDLAVPDGEHAQLRCRLTGTDPIDVFWYRENKKDIEQLEDDDKYEMGRDGNQYTLTIYNTTDKDAGGYICIGVNGEGQCSCTTKLTLKENPLEKKPPQFLKQLEDVEVVEGQGVKFMVKVKGYPVPRVSWFRDGRRIKSNDEYQLQQFGNRGYILTIDNVTLDNDAEYKVIAQNCLGRIMCDAQLLVEPKPKAPPKTQLNLLLKQTNPKVDKSAMHLDNLSQKVTMTRHRVSGTAEEVLSSAKKMSSFDESLDEMDQRLNNLEAEVSLAMDDDNTTPPSVRRKSCEETIIGEYNAKKKAAGEIRKATSTALDCLSRAERIVAARQESLPAKRKTSTSREPELFTIPDDIQNMNDLDKSDRRNSDLSDFDGQPVLDFSPPPIDSRRYSRGYIIGGETESKKQKQWDPTLTSSLHDRRQSSTRQMALADAEDEHLHKRLDTLLEKCDSKIPGGKNIYMAAGNVFSLEEKIEMLESKVNLIDDTTDEADMFMLEDEVASAVAGVTQSDRQVDNVERQVGELKKMFSRESLQSQLSTQSEADSMVDSGCGTGATTPTDLTSPRPSDIYQIEEDILELPSVQGLMTMFNCTAQVADSASPITRPNSRKVRSLTGRDLSSSITEKYRNKTPPSGQIGQPSVIRASSFNSKLQRPMSPLAVRRFPDLQQQEETTPIGGAHPRTAGPSTPGVFSPAARSSPLPQKKVASTDSRVSNANITLSNHAAAPKRNEPLVNPKRFYDSSEHDMSQSSQNSPKMKRPLVNPNRSYDSLGREVIQKTQQPKLKPQLVNLNRSYDSTGHEVVTASNQPIRATETFSTIGSLSSAKTSQEKQVSEAKLGERSDSASSQGETTPKLRRSTSSQKILSKAAFWDNRINENVSSDRDISLDEVFDGQ